MTDKVFMVTFCEYNICMENRVFRNMDKLLAELESSIKMVDAIDEETGELHTVDSLLEAGLLDISEIKIEE